ncbi:MAG: DUF2269 family protein [Gemmatimonadetes bacterium]|nr:DUF2269 family protein [Gemmatimonadota bacterium]
MSLVMWNRVYLALNTLHVLAVMLFLGSMIMGIFWKRRSDRTDEPRVIAYTLEGIVRAYRWLTLPSAALLVLFGFGMVAVGNVSLRFAWVLLGIATITVSVAVLVLRVAPAQLQLLALARSAADAGSFDRASFDRLTHQWQRWVLIATVAPMIGVALMVFKPH